MVKIYSLLSFDWLEKKVEDSHCLSFELILVDDAVSEYKVIYAN